MKTVLFDFDRTLLDTDGLKNEQARRIAKIAELTEDQVNEGMKSYIASLESHLDFEVEGYAEHLHEMFGIHPGHVLKVYLHDSEYIATFLFPEVIEVLEFLTKKVRLGILSEASFGSQQVKIDRSGIRGYFDPSIVSVVRRKVAPEVLQEIPVGSFFIDDDPDVIRAMQRFAGEEKKVIPIWIDRKKRIAESDGIINRITNLMQLLPFINDTITQEEQKL